MEPYRLKRWRLEISSGDIAYFFTCARPGRSMGPKGRVPDQVVSSWLAGLPGPDTTLVSLLGRKQGDKGSSEFSYYSFSGGLDTSSEKGNKPIIQDWLATRQEHLRILVREHPTYDYRPISHDSLNAIEADILDLISLGRTVVVVDSGGMERTGKVCLHMNATEVP